MSQINRVPRGLQDLLQSKNFGQNPRDLSQLVQPTLDMFPYYAAERRVVDNKAAAGVAVNGTYAQYDVPEGEMWLLDRLGAGVFTAGQATGPFAANLGVSLSLIQGAPLPASSTPLCHLGTLDVSATATASNAGLSFWTYEFARPYPILAGERLLFWADNLDQSGTQTYTIRPVCYYTRLET